MYQTDICFMVFLHFCTLVTLNQDGENRCFWVGPSDGVGVLNDKSAQFYYQDGSSAILVFKHQRDAFKHSFVVVILGSYLQAFILALPLSTQFETVHGAITTPWKSALKSQVFSYNYVPLIVQAHRD